MEIEQVASDLANFILKPLSEDNLESLEQWGFDPENGQHMLEILLLSFFAFRMSLDDSKKWTNPLLFKIEQQLKNTYVDIFKFGTSNQFETALIQRTKEYDLIFNGQTDIEYKIQKVGTRFASMIESQDATLKYWASRSFVEWNNAFINFLVIIDDRFELV
ncbi:MAG: hypothetical protein L0220_06165 [Acidobacteria bacterium]|nr:hypothetical protein [Acidobacteriota bacterium]